MKCPLPSSQCRHIGLPCRFTASQAYVERIFSLYGLLTAGSRNRMNQNLEMRAFVKLNRTRLPHCRQSLKCCWTRASCECGRLQIGDVTWEGKFLSNDYTNPNTNPRTLTTLALILADHHDDFERFCAPVFCDFVRNYSCTVDGAVVTSRSSFENTLMFTSSRTSLIKSA